MATETNDDAALGTMGTDALNRIADAKDLVNMMRDDAPPSRGRALSTAITKLDEARMWLREAGAA